MSGKVLVVEDDHDIAENLRELLETENYQVAIARNGAVALELLLSASEEGADRLPDLILLDLMMPIMDGAEFLARKAREPRLATIPVVVMTADGQIESKKNQLKASAFVRKPIDIPLIMDVIARACTRGGANLG